MDTRVRILFAEMPDPWAIRLTQDGRLVELLRFRGGIARLGEELRQPRQPWIGNAGDFQAGCGIDEVVGTTAVGAMRPERDGNDLRVVEPAGIAGFCAVDHEGDGPRRGSVNVDL